MTLPHVVQAARPQDYNEAKFFLLSISIAQQELTARLNDQEQRIAELEAAVRALALRAGKAGAVDVTTEPQYVEERLPLETYLNEDYRQNG
jgi:replication fork clamp-binding protein CrfC